MQFFVDRACRLLIVGLAILGWSAVPSYAGDPAPFGPDKPFSADVTVIRTMQGTTIREKVYRDGEKVRVDTESENGTQRLIFRRDLKTQYNLLERQNLVIETPWPVGHFPATFPAGTELPPGGWELLGPDTVGGIACLKYQTRDDITNPDLKIFYYWENAATKAPVQLADREESFFTRWANYIAGPQDSVLFEPPAGYAVRRVGFPRPEN
jgi:hypothetical protein